MSKGKYSRKRGMNLRPLILVLTVALLLGATIGGTIAWLTAKTDDVVNTFTVGDVTISLKETKINNWNNDTPIYETAPADGVDNAYKMIPGNTYKKDPVVAVDSTSEDCYLFVMFEESDKAGDYITYESLLTTAAGWKQDTKLPANVWYREVLKADSTKSWYLLKGQGDGDLKNGCITINAEAVTKSTMTEAAAQTLKYTAYAAQMANLTVDQAWTQVKAAQNTGSGT